MQQKHRLEGFEAGGPGIVTPMMENHMEETMENEMETGMIGLKVERKNVLKRAQEVWCQIKLSSESRFAE